MSTYSEAKALWESSTGVAVRCLLNLADTAGAFQDFEKAYSTRPAPWMTNGQAARDVALYQVRKLMELRDDDPED